MDFYLSYFWNWTFYKPFGFKYPEGGKYKTLVWVCEKKNTYTYKPTWTQFVSKYWKFRVKLICNFKKGSWDDRWAGGRYLATMKISLQNP